MKLTTNDIKSRIKDKFGDNIELLEEYKNSISIEHKFYCHEKDPITGKEHGEFTKRIDTLLKGKWGCNECNILHGMGKWKFTLLSNLKKKFPNLIFLGVKNTEVIFPRERDKLLFKCNNCGQVLSISYFDFTNRKYSCTCSIPRSYKYTREECFCYASKCNSRSEFQKKYPGAYKSARRQNLMVQYNWFKTPIKKHIDTEKNDYYIYAYDFSSLNKEEKEIYVGLSHHSAHSKRSDEHRRLRISSKTGKDISSPVRKTSIKYGLNLEKKEDLLYLNILEENLTAYEAQEREHFYVNYYRDLGYIILNKAKTGLGIGSLGGNGVGKWDNIDDCVKEVKKYKEQNIPSKIMESKLGAPLRKIRKYNKNLLQELGILNKNEFTVEDFRLECLKLKKSNPTDYHNTDEFKKLKRYLFFLENMDKKKEDEFIFWDILNIVPYRFSHGVLEFDKDFNLTRIFETRGDVAKEFECAKTTVFDWIKSKKLTTKGVFLRSEIDFLFNDLSKFSVKERESFKKKYLELGGMWYKESYNI